MPIVGNLSDFPLPEVLLLIGRRTGRLRLLDVPEFGVLDIDISNGAVQVMRIGNSAFTEASQMLDKLGIIIQSQSGMFEFRLVPVSVAARQEVPLTIHDLAMKLVCHVDEQAARQRALFSAEQRHRLVIPQPDIWMEPELNQFFMAAKSLLAIGVSMDDLAQNLQMDTTTVQTNLTHLRLIGLIEVIEGGLPTMAEEVPSAAEKLMRTSKAFTGALQMRERIRKLSS